MNELQLAFLYRLLGIFESRLTRRTLSRIAVDSPDVQEFAFPE